MLGVFKLKFERMVISDGFVVGVMRLELEVFILMVEDSGKLFREKFK